MILITYIIRVLVVAKRRGRAPILALRPASIHAIPPNTRRARTLRPWRTSLPALITLCVASGTQSAAERADAEPAAASTSTPAPTAARELPAISVSASATADPTVGYQPRTTSIAGGDNRSIKEIPQSVAVVSSSVMQDQQARTLDDVLGNISGVTQTNTLGGTRDAFIKRGFGSNNDGSVLVDGVRTPVLLPGDDRPRRSAEGRRRCSTGCGSGRRDQPRHAQAGRRLRRLDLGLAHEPRRQQRDVRSYRLIGHPGSRAARSRSG